VKQAEAKIVVLMRQVMWRRRMLSLQDSLAVALMISALMAAAFVVIVRVRPVSMPVWPVVLGMVGLAVAAALVRWFRNRTGEARAALLIDESLKLDDRVATSRLIIERGGPTGAFEEALIEDAAARVSDHRASTIAPLRARRWYALLLVSAIALTAALMIRVRSLPIDQALATERADIEAAGGHLEQTATEIEQSVPPGTETASLAKEQAEIGRGFRRATATRSEALRRLSALEERIRQRHDDLANTRAEEIVSLADRRLGNTLATLSEPRSKKFEQAESQLAQTTDVPPSDSRPASGKEAQAPAADKLPVPSGKSTPGSRRQSPTRGESTNGNRTTTSGSTQLDPQKRLQEPVSASENRNADSGAKTSNRRESKGNENSGAPGAAASQPAAPQKQSDSPPGDPGAVAGKTPEQNSGERKPSDSTAPEPPAISPEALKAVPDGLVQQAAKALPKLSEELLKKAAELRANELSASDIEKLRKAAESLARDLDQIGQSKELQKALQDMARQVRPEQIDQVARELGNQEKLKQELEATARLLSENRQAKEMVAGLAGQFARSQDEKRRPDDNQRGSGKSDMRDQPGRAGDDSSPGRRSDSGAAPEKLETAKLAITGSGRESSVKGKLQQRPGGEYLYLQSKAGDGAARAPYSSAYPRYRREAERSVQRSQVPANLRSMVRKYFDAINPDAKQQ
jgi:hypothetical protein